MAVNKQNFRIWDDDNLQAIVETPLNPEKVTVWFVLWAGGIVGPYVLNNNDQNITVNGKRSRGMITNFLVHQLQGINVADMFYYVKLKLLIFGLCKLQDGCHNVKSIFLIRKTRKKQGSLEISYL